MAKSKDLASSQATTTLTILEGFRFQVNFKKSVLSPTTVIEFLGFTMNSITDPFTPSRQSQESEKGVPNFARQPLSNYPGAAQGLGPSHFLHPSSFSGSPSLPAFTDRHEKGLQRK